MANSIYLKEKFIPLPITQAAFQKAQLFAHQQPTPQKAEQVYLNTLAVWVVNDYLLLVEIDTDLKESDSWNPLVQMYADVADLQLRGLGKLECRPVRVYRENEVEKSNPSKSSLVESQPKSSHNSAPPICNVPPEVWDERIGYVAVQIDENRKEATLLGFAKTAGAGKLAVNQLQSMDALLEHLEHLAQPKVNLKQWFLNVFETGWQEVQSLFSAEPEQLASTRSSASQLNLSQWFQNVFDMGWQAVEELFSSQRENRLQFRGTPPVRHTQAVAFRRGKSSVQLFPEADITRAKLIDLGMYLGTQTIALLVALTQESEQKVNIFVQVHPASGEMYLPPQLKLALLAESGETLQEVESRGQDLCIQLRPFKVQTGTSFSLLVALDEVSITESFAV